MRALTTSISRFISADELVAMNQSPQLLPSRLELQVADVSFDERYERNRGRERDCSNQQKCERKREPFLGNPRDQRAYQQDPTGEQEEEGNRGKYCDGERA